MDGVLVSGEYGHWLDDIRWSADFVSVDVTAVSGAETIRKLLYTN